MAVDDDLQLENSFAALSVVQDLQINAGLSPCLSQKLPVADCSGAELCPGGGAEVGAALGVAGVAGFALAILPWAGSVSVGFRSAANLRQLPCGVSEPGGWPGSSPKPRLLPLLLFFFFFPFPQARSKVLVWISEPLGLEMGQFSPVIR